MKKEKSTKVIEDPIIKYTEQKEINVSRISLRWQILTNKEERITQEKIHLKELAKKHNIKLE